ncbi:MAG: LL-diaminopimelate aminotransferase [Eggerthellaceae bacterium]|jgi:LL-diaminopimelate aminotransferase
MATINQNYLKLPGSYLFSEIARRTAAYQEEHPDVKLIKMGIGDVTRPLAPAVIDAMHQAVDDMAHAETFHGYGPEQGYAFLREAIVAGDFASRGVDIAPDEVFVSDGAKSDTGNIGDILGFDNRIAVCDPVYPVYVDTNAMAGRAGYYDESVQAWSNIHYMPTTAENGFCPALPEDGDEVDVIYLCSPNNPTGTVLNFDQLKAWVDYANAHDALIMFDAAYERFITEEGVPHSIYEVPGAKTCAIEFRSFSKTAGFTGARCGYTVVPKELVRQGTHLNDLWLRRQTTKFNGASYIIQRGAAAIYTPEGKQQVEDTIAYYRHNAHVVKEGLEAAGFAVFGAVNSPYIWFKTPEGTGSWEFFDALLTRAHVITTPGAGFGPSGEGYIRLTAFGDADATVEAVERIKKLAAEGAF